MNAATETRQAHDLLRLATKQAKRKLGAAWDSAPYLRDQFVAIELLAAMAGKDAEEATDTTARIMIEAATLFAQQRET